MNRPLFSICIPNFNYGHYIGQTVKSVLNQTFQDFEIIIQDNDSTDDSWKIIQDISVSDNRIRVFKNNCNVGFAPNLNKVTRNAVGEYIILLSADDLMMETALENYAQVIEQATDKHNIIICSNTIIVDGKSNETGILKKQRNEFKLSKTALQPGDKDQNTETEIMQGHQVLKHALDTAEIVSIFCATCFSSKQLEAVEGYDEVYQFGPDTGFLLRLLNKNPVYYWLHTPLFKYGVHETNQSSLTKNTVALKYELDGYRTTQLYNDSFLNGIGTSRKKIIEVYLKRVCLYNSMVAFKTGKFKQSFASYFFGLSVYTGSIVRLKEFYLITILMILLPVLYIPIKMYNYFKKRN